MLDQTARIQAWFAESAAIKAEIEASGLPAPLPTRTRRRKRKPLWEK